MISMFFIRQSMYLQFHGTLSQGRVVEENNRLKAVLETAKVELQLAQVRLCRDALFFWILERGFDVFHWTINMDISVCSTWGCKWPKNKIVLEQGTVWWKGTTASRPS